MLYEVITTANVFLTNSGFFKVMKACKRVHNNLQVTFNSRRRVKLSLGNEAVVVTVGSHIELVLSAVSLEDYAGACLVA